QFRGAAGRTTPGRGVGLGPAGDGLLHGRGFSAGVDQVFSHQVRLGVQVIGHAAEHRSNLGRVGAIRVPAFTSLTPAGSAEACRKTSWPSSLARNPKPFSVSNHLTLPMGTLLTSFCLNVAAVPPAAAFLPCAPPAVHRPQVRPRRGGESLSLD